MTAAPTRRPVSATVTPVQLQALRDEMHQTIAAVAAKADEAKAISADTNARVRDLHAALMEPSPGQQTALLDRMALATITLESGYRVGRLLLWVAAVAASLGALLKIGILPEIGGRP
jgi:hypothetical protein